MTAATGSPPLKFNVRINQHRYAYGDLLRVWQLADRLGYYSASLYDLLNADALECWTTLTALLTQTERIRAVPMVLSNPYRHPALVAKMAATLDVISGGRITLGIGAGGSRRDALASGIPFPNTRTRCAMLEEAAALIRQLWTEPAVDYHGRHYQVAGASVQPKPVQRPAPPILVGGHGARYVLPTVGRIADLCNVGSNNTVAEHRQREDIIRQAAVAAGPQPRRHRTHPQRPLRNRPNPTGIRPPGSPPRRTIRHHHCGIPKQPSPQHPIRHPATGNGANCGVCRLRHPLLLHHLPRLCAVRNPGTLCDRSNEPL